MISKIVGLDPCCARKDVKKSTRRPDMNQITYHTSYILVDICINTYMVASAKLYISMSYALSYLPNSKFGNFGQWFNIKYGDRALTITVANTLI